MTRKEIAVTEFCVIIPARMASARLQRKPLLEINGRPMIEHVYCRACQSGAADVVVATDSEEIASHIKKIGGQVCMTSAAPACGTERVAEAAEKLGWGEDTTVVNSQCDEPGLRAADFEQTAVNLIRYPDADITTLAMPMRESDCREPHHVKVVTDTQGMGLYFSRASIPYNTRTGEHLHHIGIYGYSVGTLKRFARLPQCSLEKNEGLEQLRALYHGMRIHVGVVEPITVPGVDTEEDLIHARTAMARS